MKRWIYYHVEESVDNAQSLLFAQKLQEILKIGQGDFWKLVRLADIDKSVRAKCSHPLLEKYWDEPWALMGSEPSYKESKRDPNVEYRPLVTESFSRDDRYPCQASLIDSVPLKVCL